MNLFMSFLSSLASASLNFFIALLAIFFIVRNYQRTSKATTRNVRENNLQNAARCQMPPLPKYLRKNAKALRRIRRGRLHVSSEDARKQFVMIQRAMAGVVDSGYKGTR